MDTSPRLGGMGLGSEQVDLSRTSKVFSNYMKYKVFYKLSILKNKRLNGMKNATSGVRVD